MSTVLEARQRPETGDEIVILENPDLAGLEEAVKVCDAAGLPRWAVVVLGRSPQTEFPDADAVTGVEADPKQIAFALRSAATQRQLRRENARLRGDLLTIATRIAHDLRAPLSAISTSVAVLQSVIAKEHPDGSNLTKLICNSIDDSSKLITRFSQFLKAVAGPLDLQPVCMGAVVWSAILRRQVEAARVGANISQPKSWPQVNGVAALLEMVWVNLIDNALKHGKKGSPIELGWKRSGQEMHFWVNNDANSDAPNIEPNLFQQFHQLHLPGSASGLGLAIVRRVVELHGGRCGYARLPTGGSSFSFTLPALAKNPHSGTAQTAE